MNSNFDSEIIENNSEIYNYIYRKSYIDNPNIALSDLRYITVLYVDFDGKEKVGHLIVNKLIEEDTLYIFEELYKNKYQINSIKLIEEYWTGDNKTSDDNSMINNNSSSFNYREIAEKDYLSYHAFGLAIDINPLNNPYIINRDGILDYESLSRKELFYAKNRSSDIAHVITHDDLAFKLFSERGFEWGGDWNGEIESLDYQHFEKPITDNKVYSKKEV